MERGIAKLYLLELDRTVILSRFNGYELSRQRFGVGSSECYTVQSTLFDPKPFEEFLDLGFPKLFYHLVPQG